MTDIKPYEKVTHPRKDRTLVEGVSITQDGGDGGIKIAVYSQTTQLNTVAGRPEKTVLSETKSVHVGANGEVTTVKSDGRYDQTLDKDGHPLKILGNENNVAEGKARNPAFAQQVRDAVKKFAANGVVDPSEVSPATTLVNQALKKVKPHAIGD